ncbi:MAG TPA: TIGR02300 family protein [Thermoanaerobaculia bacterium]
MPELKLGTKYDCYNCGTKFYDLGKSEPICPKCGANQKDAVTADSLAASQSSRRRRKADTAKPIDLDEDEAALEPVAIADDEMVEPELADADLDDDEEEEDFDDED